MKKIYYFRHSKKNGSIIAEEGIILAVESAINVQEIQFTDLFHGILIRTAQTLIAIITGLSCRLKGTKLIPPVEGAKLHPPIDEIGNQEKFDEIVSDEFRKLTKEGKSNLEALRKTLSPEKFQKFLEWAAEGVKKMFSQMEGDNALACGHSPVIEAAAEYFTGEEDSYQPKECEFYEFVFHNSGDITVVIWKNGTIKN